MDAPRVHWRSDRDELAFAEVVDERRELPEEVDGRWVGGVSFDRQGGAGLWAGFPAQRWLKVSPNARAHEPGSAAARVKAAPGGAAPSGRRQDWSERVRRALEEIRAGRLRKVVLARAIDLDGQFDPTEVVARLSRRFPSCCTFALPGLDGSTFVGATPETLFRLEGRELYTEALAGSARPGAVDALFEAKSVREHRHVVEFIVDALQPLVEDAVVRPREVVRLPNVVHLKTPIRAKVKPGVGAGRLLEALHPTPAVAGSPRGAAMDFLAEHEALLRGWYAGAIGWVERDRAEFRVALRCALLHRGGARLFVGAGIVEGSEPELEWAETEDKALAMLDALEVRRAA